MKRISRVTASLLMLATCSLALAGGHAEVDRSTAAEAQQQEIQGEAAEQAAAAERAREEAETRKREEEAAAEARRYEEELAAKARQADKERARNTGGRRTR